MAAKTYPKTKLVISLFSLVLFVSTTAHSKIIYVDSDVTGVKDGSSWANAYKYLQDALAAAYSGDEIRVAQGIYKPDRGTRITHRDRDATFQLINGVTIKGGYAGYSEPNPNACDVDLYETILSGDLNGDDGPNFANNDENSYQVVNGSGTDATAVLDGVTITAGNANGTGTYGYGSGMYNDMGSPTLTNCTFNRNWADGSGGGMYNYDGRPTLINCTFSDNLAGNKGGGVYSHDTYEMTLINCKFSGNSAGEDGGGMACWYNYSNSPTLTNCIFSGNSAGSKGGGMSFVESEPVLSNCSFSGNSAGNKGGGIYMNFWYGYPVLTNCILWGNSDFAGMAESAQINTDSYGPPVINYICVQGWTGVLGGTGNIGDDPLFVDPNNGDYHLLPSSPCINAGDPNYLYDSNETDLNGKPRVIGGRIDMGAYEFQRGPRDLYVDDDATGKNDGSSWDNAYNYLQDALAAASSGNEIWVAHGIYKPDQRAWITPGDREATFQLINGVAIKGGYAGFGEPDPNARDIHAYQTILSGDLNGDDVEVTDPKNLFDEPTRAENSYHVVTGSGIDATAVLDGFTITAGNANGSEDNEGGGMCNSSSSPTVNNCVFSTNSATHGGGMYNWDNSNPTLTNCTFSNNSADRAGGMLNRRFSNPTLTNCTFIDNSATTLNGGGMDNLWVCRPTLTNCTFRGNSAAQYGGGLDNYLSSPTLTNCTFTDNSAEDGGGMYNRSESNPTLTNCTFSRNEAYTGSGGGLYNSASNPILTNCMFRSNFGWNGGGGMYNDCSSPTLTNCTFRRNWVEFNGGGMSNYDSTPKLTNCTFTANDSSDGDGAGMFNDSSSPMLTKCTFRSNLSFWYGAGIHNCHESSPILTNCAFSGNLGWIGGGMLNSDSNATLTNCIFSTNMADLSGGGIENWGSSITLTNCTFTANSGHGGALVCNSWRQESPSNIKVTNCILWDGGDEIWNNDNSAIAITYSDVQGGWEGEGNIEADPCFVALGHWDVNGVWVDGDHNLRPDSPCINAGDPNHLFDPNETDLDGRPRVIGGRIDMGAYEYGQLISAEARILPQTINLASKGKWIICYIWLPEEYNVADVDSNSVLLEDEIKPDEFSVDEQQQVATAIFNREEVQTILEVGDIDLTITGRLTEGIFFEGKDTIKVLNKAGKN